MSDKQESATLQAPEERASAKASETVHIVLGNYPDDPHPHVEGVYDNEDAANRHEQALTDSHSIQSPVAWGTHEVAIQSGIEECPICGSDEWRVEESSSPLDDRARCENCRCKWRLGE